MQISIEKVDGCLLTAEGYRVPFKGEASVLKLEYNGSCTTRGYAKTVHYLDEFSLFVCVQGATIKANQGMMKKRTVANRVDFMGRMER